LAQDWSASMNKVMNKDDRVMDSTGRTGTFYRYDKYRDGTFAMVKFDDAMSLRRVNPAELTLIRH